MKNTVFLNATPCGSIRMDVTEECIASIFTVTRIGELGTTLVVSSNRFQKTTFCLTFC
jgi:hypothetical protein